MNTFEIMRLIGEMPASLLNSTETLILMRIALSADRSGKDAQPGLQKIIDTTKLSRSTVLRTLKFLIDKKALNLCSTRKKGSRERSKYSINIDFFKNKNTKRSGVTMTPETGVTMTLVKNIPVSQRHLTGVTMTPETGVTMTPTPYTPHLEPIEPRSIVKSSDDLTTDIFQDKRKKSPKKKKSWSVEILEIFEHWKQVMKHPSAKFDEARKRKIEKALGEHGYTVDELKKAIDGAKKSAWHRGENPEGKIYDSIGLIFRNPEKIETFISIFDTETRPKSENVATGQKNAFWENTRRMGEILRLHNPLRPGAPPLATKKDRNQTKSIGEQSNE